jgi:hypothetical protein
LREKAAALWAAFFAPKTLGAAWVLLAAFKLV